MSEHCDNRSVGVIMTDEAGRVLLVNRAKPPYGWAAPAGHVDSHGGSIETAIEEVEEETGLVLARSSLAQILEGYRIDGACSRGGQHHDWDVWAAPLPGGEATAKPDEVRGIMLADRFVLQALHQQTEYASYDHPGLEPAWGKLFTELGYLSQNL